MEDRPKESTPNRIRQVPRRPRTSTVPGCAVVLALAVTLSARVLFAQAAPDGARILALVDQQLNFVTSDFAASMTLVAEDPTEGIDRQEVRLFRRDSGDSFVIIIEEPIANRGQGYLRVEENLWFYDPESRSFSRTTERESFQGSDARNADLGSSSLSQDYTVASVGEGRLGVHDVWVLELEAISNEIPFPFRTIWVTRSTNLVLKSEDYSVTQRLLRTSYYPRYSRVGSSYVPQQMIFVDALIEGQKTTITFRDVSLETLPDSVFTQAYLERVSR